MLIYKEQLLQDIYDYFVKKSRLVSQNANQLLLQFLQNADVFNEMRKEPYYLEYIQ